ncbi:MAG: ATP-dependent helicase, partial [Candidatus Hydrogenedentes bacterium]|nr:ATP-dependent helicase [Candidatus Hydrogenedentota bacterium]
MYEIRLTPAGKLRWEADQNVDISAALKKIASSFNVNWAEGLFLLSAKKVNVADFVTLQYWQGVGDCYLTQLCHIPEEEKAIAIPAPTSAKYAEWTLTAPPMQGGEYLSVEMLEGIWQALDSWTKTAIDASGSLGIFLNKVAPKWAQIGRVCFHLAENKADEKRPFAFMASYTTGFGISGKIKHQPLHQALSQYAGTKNTAALVRLLSPVQRASEGLPWVKALVDTGSIYQPMVWTADRAYQFLCDVTVLEECGVSVRLPNWWQKRVRPKVSVKIGTIKASTLGVDTMLDFDVAVALGNISLSHKELQELLEGPDGLIMLKGQWVEVDREKLQEAITHWETLHAQSHNGKISFIEGMRLLAGATEDLKDQEELDDLRPWAQISAGDALRETLAALRCPKRLDQVKNDGVVDATLRPYQREGVAWLRFLSELGLGACLADDMGLGKTLQVLALLQHSKHNRISDEIGPALLIVPASLMGNWRSEAERFTP